MSDPHEPRPQDGHPPQPWPQSPPPQQQYQAPQHYQQQPPFPVQQYQQPSQVWVTQYAQPSPPRGLSVASMVIGLVSIFFGFTFLVPLVGLVLGIVGLKKEPAGRGMAVAGLILNGLFVVGWLLLIVFVFGVGFLGLAGAGVSGTAS